MHHGLVTETAFFVIAIASGLAGVSGSFHLGRRFGFGIKQGGGLNALVLGEVGEEALETLRWERDSALEAAAPADVGRVQLRYLRIYLTTLAGIAFDRITAGIFPSAKMD